MRIRIPLASLLGLLLASGCHSPARPAPPTAAQPQPLPVEQKPREEKPLARSEPQAIRVGAWNIEWLGSPNQRSGPAKGHAQTPQALAEYILAADVDIFALAEIARSDATADWTNDTITAALRLVEQETAGKWQHRLFPARSGRNQCCGIAWDTTRVTATDQPCPVTQPEEKSLQGKPLWSRPPHGLTFSAGEGLTDFVVIPIHMKSNYGGDFAHHRAEEAVHLMIDLPQTYQDGDVIVIGDSNCGTHDEPAIAVFETGGFVDLNAADIPTHWKYGALDRAFVPEMQPEFAEQHFEVLSDTFFKAHELTAEDFKINYSDHYMVITQVTVMPDDD